MTKFPKIAFINWLKLKIQGCLYIWVKFRGWGLGLEFVRWRLCRGLAWGLDWVWDLVRVGVDFE